MSAQVIKECANILISQRRVPRDLLKEITYTLELDEPDENQMELEVVKPQDFVQFIETILENPLGDD